jgi:hypothetical protein
VPNDKTQLSGDYPVFPLLMRSASFKSEDLKFLVHNGLDNRDEDSIPIRLIKM